jgi:hypothetical protein
MNLQDTIKHICKEIGDEPRFSSNYSGRGMYGKSCIAISGSHSDCMYVISDAIKQLASQLGRSDDYDHHDFNSDVDILLSFSTDSMGLGQVYYWRGLASKQADQEATSEEENS